MAVGVQTKGTRDRFGATCPRAVNCPVAASTANPAMLLWPRLAHIQESPRRREVNLGAGVPRGEPVGQGRERLHRGEGAGRRVQTIGRDTAALLVGEIDERVG